MADSSEADGLTTRIILLKTFLAGGIAGCCAKSTVAPFDRVKILLQAHSQHYRHLGVFSTIGGVVKKEGTIGLYKGNGAQMIRIFPYAAVQFVSYESYKKVLHKWIDKSTHVNKLLAGSLAGSTAVMITYPLDVIRARLAFQVTGEHVYSGIGHAFISIFKHEGVCRGLYRGIVPTLLGMVPYAGLSFYGFETLKELCLKYYPEALGTPSPNNPNSLMLIIPAKLLCGGLAGAFAQTLSYPLDVARRKMQLADMLPESHKFSSWQRTLVVVFQEHGVKNGLYRGLSINYLRVMPMVAVSFCSYEQIKQMLGLDTGVER